MNDIAMEIVRKANSKNISIRQLCREAGTSRQWFEDLKVRVPKSIHIYLRMNEILKSEDI